MRRICCFCECWESGGIESFLCNVLLRMNLSSTEVDIVASQIKSSVFTQALKEHGVQFIELSGSQHRIQNNHRLFRALLQARHYDVVHLNIFQGMSLYYAHLAKQAGVPIRIAHSHNTDLRASRTKPIKLWLHRQYSHRYAADATDFWACSKEAARFLFPENLLQRRSFTWIPNGIDTKRFAFDPTVRERVRRELGVSGQFVIGNVGRLCAQKNQRFLLDVFMAVLHRHPQSQLLLVGEGEDLPMLRDRARALGIEHRVTFYGTTSRPEELLCAMDVFTFPSRFEGLGIAAVEAQAAGLPVVCSEFVPREAYVTRMVPCSLSDGAEAWAAALLERQETRDRREMSAAVRAAGFDVADTAALIENRYKEKQP